MKPTDFSCRIPDIFHSLWNHTTDDVSGFLDLLELFLLTFFVVNTIDQKTPAELPLFRKFKQYRTMSRALTTLKPTSHDLS